MSNELLAASSRLRANSLGVGAVTFFVVSAAGPLVAMAAGVPVAMLLGNGAGIPAMFIVATSLLLAFAAGFTAMASHVKAAGGFYAFAAQGLGGHAAGATAAIALFSYVALQVGIYGLFGSAAADLVRDFAAVALPWWVYAFVAMGLIAVLGYRQVELSAKVLSVLVICEYAVVLVFDVAVLRDPHSELTAAAFSPDQIGAGSPAIGLLICFTAFIGFEATTIYAEEARDPGRTIPRATYIALLLIGGFYVFSSWCLVAAVGHAGLVPLLTRLSDPTTLLFHLADSHVGASITILMRVLLITSAFASMLAFHNAIARYIFCLAREGLLPAALAGTHAVHRSPCFASLAQTAGAAVIVVFFVVVRADPIGVLFARVSSVGTLGIVALMAIASAAVFSYFRSRPGNWWRTRFLPCAGTAGLAGVLALGCARFDVLAGGYSPAIAWLPLLVLLAALAGVIATERLRRRDAGGFRRLGRVAL
jgi:amino acid transporter